MTEAQRITAALGGKWFRSYGASACPICQTERRKGQNALTLSDLRDGKLVAHCKKGGCTFKDILDALRGLGIIEGRGAVPQTDPAELARFHADQKLEAEKKERQALSVWNEAAPIGGTIAEAYLRNRGITCVLPDCLRFHGACWHPTAKRYPALIARIDGAERFALHRTYLRADGSGKAPLDIDKAMLGAVAGGAVRLIEAAGPLVVAEGIENSPKPL